MPSPKLTSYLVSEGFSAQDPIAKFITGTGVHKLVVLPGAIKDPIGLLEFFMT